ncbi:MAG: queuosine precursor transporter [Clostridia bacterium]
MNELIFFISIIVNFTGLICMYKYFGKTGLFVWIAFATIAANIEVIKCVDMFAMKLTLGNVLYGSVSLASDILNENYGFKSAKDAVKIGFCTMLIFTVAAQFTLAYIPNQIDFASSSLQTIFALSPRIFLGSIIAYFVSSTVNVNAFNYIRKKLPQDKYFYIRNNASTMLAQIIDTAIFTAVAFIGVFPLKDCIILVATTYAVKVCIALLDTPFLYIAKEMKRKNKVKEI